MARGFSHQATECSGGRLSSIKTTKDYVTSTTAGVNKTLRPPTAVLISLKISSFVLKILQN